MLSDLENIQIIPLNNEYVFRQQAILSKVAQVLGVSTLQLGHTDAFFSERPLGRLDQHFYVQAGLPIDYRWSRFLFNRNERRVLELNERLCIDGNGQYAFLHEDRNRGFIVKRTYISQGLRVIEPNPKWPYSIFDYCDVISRAKEIHCIESSFSIFIDSFDFPKTKLFAHRYARPEVYSDGRHEIGYRKNWDIVER
jgi:hypothetical protein